MTKTFWICIAFVGGLAITCQFALPFAVVTLVVSFLVFSKIEADQNVYDVGFLNDAVEWVHGALDQAVGEPVASILMVLFNSEILMGFMVVLYTYLLLLLTTPELRLRLEDPNVQPATNPDTSTSPESSPEK